MSYFPRELGGGSTMLIADLSKMSARQKAGILADPHFGNSALRNVDPEHLLQEYKSLYVDCLRPFRHARPIHTVADIGSGYAGCHWHSRSRQTARSSPWTQMKRALRLPKDRRNPGCTGAD
jgi:hypothetical protein